MTDILSSWTIDTKETSNGCWMVSCVDRVGRKVERSGTNLEEVKQDCISDIRQITLDLNLKTLTDSLCDRRDLKSLGIVIPGIQSINGLTDGWHHCYDALRELKQLRRDELTPDESTSLDIVRSIVSEIIKIG